MKKIYDSNGTESVIFPLSYKGWEKFKEWTRLDHEGAKRIWSSSNIIDDPVFGKARQFKARIIEMEEL